MERNEFLEKCKRNWKKILIIGAASYLALTFISTAVGTAFISDKAKKIDNCEDEIGQEFQARKADFYDRYYDNWEKGLDKMSKGFVESEKRSDKFGLDGLKGAQETTQKMLNNEGLFAWKERPESDKIKLQQELKERAYLITTGEAAFKKKWFSQRDDESHEEYERRCDEGKIDWQLHEVDYYAWILKDTTDEFKYDERKQTLNKEKERFQNMKESFLAKYGEEYPRKSSLSLCNL